MIKLFFQLRMVFGVHRSGYHITKPQLSTLTLFLMQPKLHDNRTGKLAIMLAQIEMTLFQLLPPTQLSLL